MSSQQNFAPSLSLLLHSEHKPAQLGPLSFVQSTHNVPLAYDRMKISYVNKRAQNQAGPSHQPFEDGASNNSDTSQKEALLVSVVDAQDEKINMLKELSKANEAHIQQLLSEIESLQTHLSVSRSTISDQNRMLQTYNESMGVMRNNSESTHQNYVNATAELDRIKSIAFPTVVGRGSYGIVFKCYDPTDDQIVAVKNLNYNEHNLKELVLIHDLSHPNICVPYKAHYSGGIEARPRFINLIMDFVETDLWNFVQENGQLEYRLRRKVMFQILSAVAYIHEKGIIHRDIKPDNVLYDEKEEIALLTDFGLSTKAQDSVEENFIGNIRYSAPELLFKTKKYTAAIDMWAVGCLFYELITGNILFTSNKPAMAAYELQWKLGKPTPSDVAGLGMSQTLVSGNNFSGDVFQNELSSFEQSEGLLLSAMLRYNPQERITAAGALFHSYFSSI